MTANAPLSSPGPSLPAFLRTPVGARVLPFVLFILLTFGQGKLGPASPYWLYAVKTLLVGWLLWSLRNGLEELEWRLSLEAVVAGIGVFLLWIGLEDLLARLGLPTSFLTLKTSGAAWNPHAQFGQGSPLAWALIGLRIAGSALVVPPLEELFFRSFLYRYLIRVDFLSVQLGSFRWFPFLATSLIFGFEHREWFAGLLCGLCYQGLVCRRKRLGDAVTAHAITNLLLGLHVAWTGRWIYW